MRSNPDGIINRVHAQLSTQAMSGEQIMASTGLTKGQVTNAVFRLKHYGYPVNGGFREGYRLESVQKAPSGNSQDRGCMGKAGSPRASTHSKGESLVEAIVEGMEAFLAAYRRLAPNNRDA